MRYIKNKKKHFNLRKMDRLKLMSDKQIKTNIEAAMFVISALKYHVQIPEHECLIGGTMALRKNHDILARKLHLMQGVLKASLTLSEKVKPWLRH
jgi:hypothetical protein